MSKIKVNMCRLKNFASEKLPKNWLLYDIILSEKDEMDVNIFLARLPVWLRLSKFSDTARDKK
jgi:hypothetical protein